MRVLSTTMVLPNPVQPQHGVFVRERLRRAAARAEIVVVAPIPYFPGATGRMENRPAGVPARRRDGPLQVHHPRFWSPPGLGKSLDGLLYALSVRRTVLRLHAEAPFDLVDGHFAYPDGFAAVLLARWLGVPATVTLRGSVADFVRRPSRRWALRWALSRADAVFSVSAALRDEAVGLATDEIEVIANGIDAELFRPRPRAEARRRLGLPATAPVVASVGALREVKGHHHLLRAVASLAATRPDLVLAVVGGPGVSDDRSRQLRRLGRELGLEARLVWAGARPHQEVPWWLAAADVFALASRREGCCNALLEAQACGRPVVATAVGGNPEIVHSDELGILVPPSAPDALAAALDRALEREWDEDRIRAAVADRTWEAVADKVVDRWRRLLRRRQAAPAAAPDQAGWAPGQRIRPSTSPGRSDRLAGPGHGGGA